MLAFDASVGEAAASARLDLEARSLTIGMADYLIAGICLSRSATLLTRNRKHFKRIPSLLTADP